MNTRSNPLLSRRDRLRRVVLLCCSFSRNVAFYRAGQAEQAQPFLSEHHPEAAFWRQVNANFLDMAVLDCCKLFGGHVDAPLKRLGKHHWRRVATDPTSFERALLARLQLDRGGFAALITRMRRYRDEFIAHLDDGLVMHIPELNDATAAVDHYHSHIAEHEAQEGDLGRLPTARRFALGYHQCSEEVARVYSAQAIRVTA